MPFFLVIYDTLFGDNLFIIFLSISFSLSYNHHRFHLYLTTVYFDCILRLNDFHTITFSISSNLSIHTQLAYHRRSIRSDAISRTLPCAKFDLDHSNHFTGFPCKMDYWWSCFTHSITASDQLVTSHFITDSFFLQGCCIHTWTLSKPKVFTFIAGRYYLFPGSLWWLSTVWVVFYCLLVETGVIYIYNIFVSSSQCVNILATRSVQPSFIEPRFRLLFFWVHESYKI